MSITITAQQARDLLFALDYYILELEGQRLQAGKAGQPGRAHVLTSLISSYNKTYHAVNMELAKEIEGSV